MSGRPAQCARHVRSPPPATDLDPTAPTADAVPAASAVGERLLVAAEEKRSRNYLRQLGRVGPWAVAVVPLIYLLNLASDRLMSVTPDGATVLLEGQSIATGNVALRGWALSLDSFWGIDAAFYALAVRLVGLRVDLLHIVPALLAALVIVVAVGLAVQGRRGPAAGVAAGVVVALLALPSPDLAYYLLQGPWHIGTALYCLLAFYGLGRGRFDWGFALAVLLLALGLLSDLLILGFGVLPCLVAGGVATLRCRRWRAGMPTILGGLASVALALGLRELTQAIGSFTLVNRNLVVRAPQMQANLSHLGNRLSGLLGFGSITLGPFDDGSSASRLLHLLGLVAVSLGLLAGLVAMTRGIFTGASRQRGSSQLWRIEDLLCFAILGDLATFVLDSPNGHSEYVKYR